MTSQEQFIKLCEERYGMELMAAGSGLALMKTAEGFEVIVFEESFPCIILFLCCKRARNG